MTSIDSSTGGVTISWTAPYAGGSAITSYLIEISNTLGTTWNTELTHCDGSTSTIKTNLYCTIPMSTLTAAPFSYTFDQLV